MKLYLIGSLILTAGLVSACSTTSTSTNPTFMTQPQMAAYCRGEAASEFSTNPSYVTVASPLPAVGGGYVVTGSVDQGAMGNPPFQCMFGAAGNFVSLNRL